MLSSRGSNGIPERIPIDLPGGVPAYLPISLQLHTISCNIQKMTSWNDPNAFMTLSPPLSDSGHEMSDSGRYPDHFLSFPPVFASNWNGMIIALISVAL